MSGLGKRLLGLKRIDQKIELVSVVVKLKNKLSIELAHTVRR